MLLQTDKLTPNIKALFIERWAQLTLERSIKEPGEFGAAIGVAMSLIESGGQTWKDNAKEAFKWTSTAIETVRKALGPQWSEATDEEVAGVILRRLAERKHEKR